jgi:isopentenyldiphosphate isomerase
MQNDPIDICDEQGKLTGDVLPFEIVHDKELWHRVTLAWIYNSQSDVLLQHRSAERDAFPNVWDVSVSGHIRSGDSAIATAVHELREHLGIQVQPKELMQIGTLTDVFPLVNGKTHREHATVFIVHRDVNLERMEFRTADVDGARWMNLRELAADMDNPETRAQYTSRNPEVYRLALEAIWNLTAPD